VTEPGDHSAFDVALATVAAPELPLDPCQELENLLLEHFAIAPPALIESLDKLIERHAYALAGEALRRLLKKIPANTASAVALRRVLSGDREETTREAGKRCGVSHVAVLKAEKRLRKWTGLPS
jgi:hypothetical protein